jgi:hypothetical protein
MSRRSSIAAAIAACAVAVSAPASFAAPIAYDFSTVSGQSTPASIKGATFGSPGDPGAFTFGPNGGLFTDLGATVLSSGGLVETLTISFARLQTGLAFDFALGDFLGNGDTLTVQTNTGVSMTGTANAVGGDLFPEGSFDLSDPGQFSSVTITSSFPIVIADMTTTAPEPASLALFGAGIIGLLAVRRR